jgi:hypothetical protein
MPQDAEESIYLNAKKFWCQIFMNKCHINQHRTEPRPLHWWHLLRSILQCRHVFREPQEVLTLLLCLLWNGRESSQHQLMQQVTTGLQHCTSIICQAHCNHPKSYTDKLQIHVISWGKTADLLNMQINTLIQWLLYIPLSSIFKNSVFCPFMCFTWFSQ